MIERGYHSLFFPGRHAQPLGGRIEQRLKLGAGRHRSGGRSPVTRCGGINRPVYFVPATINYALVLEAETLIDDHLKEAGRARYIIEDDEFSRVERWNLVLQALPEPRERVRDPVRGADGPVRQPGEDEQGESLAPDGRVIDAGSYVTRRGSAVVERGPRRGVHPRARPQHRQELRQGDGGHGHASGRPRDLPAAVSGDARARPICAPAPPRGTSRSRSTSCRRRSGRRGTRCVGSSGRAGSTSTGRSPAPPPSRSSIRALEAWEGYHQRAVARVVNGSVIAEDPNLLLFYQNRMRLFAHDICGDHEGDAQAAKEIAAMETLR